MKFQALPTTSFEDVTLDLEQLQALLANAAWTALTLLNPWATLAGSVTVGYMKDPLGFVHLRGRATGGANGTPAFTLPDQNARELLPRAQKKDTYSRR